MYKVAKKGTNFFVGGSDKYPFFVDFDRSNTFDSMDKAENFIKNLPKKFNSIEVRKFENPKFLYRIKRGKYTNPESGETLVVPELLQFEVVRKTRCFYFIQYYFRTKRVSRNPFLKNKFAWESKEMAMENFRVRSKNCLFYARRFLAQTIMIINRVKDYDNNLRNGNSPNG